MNSNSVICESKQCIQSAAMLMNSMDTSVDPCDDFYQYACGRWSEKRFPPDNVSNSWASERTKYIEREVIEVLSMESTRLDPLPLRQARILYSSCLDTETLDTLGLQPMFHVLTKAMLPTVIPSSATAQSFQLAQTLALAKRFMSSDILVGIGSIFDQVSKIAAFKIVPSYVVSPLQELLSDYKYMYQSGRQLFATKLSYVTSVLSEIEPESNSSSLAIAALNILEFDAQIEEDIRLTHSYDRPIRTTFANLQMLMDNHTNGTFTSNNRIDWNQYLDVVMNGTSTKLNLSSVVFVQSPAYFVILAKRLSVAKPETIQRLIWWKIVESLSSHTTTTMRKIRDVYLETLFGSSTRLNRVKRCASITKSLFKMAISYKMATSTDTKTTASKVRSMLMDITEAFELIVKSKSWMDDETKQASIGQVKSMTSFIGYHDWLLKPGELDKFYSGLTINGTQYLWSLLNIKISKVTKALFYIGKPPPDITNNRWIIDSLQINAWYIQSINQIGMQYMYNKKGQLVPWWNEQMIRVHDDKAKCFVDQYGSYSLGSTQDLKINGSLTLIENIADNGGIRQALAAYLLYKMRQGSEPLLPGLHHLSHEQLFFLAFANIWCATSTPTDDLLSLKDYHSPNKFRVIGSLSNSPDFSYYWNCSAGSPMNPDKKCELW